MFQDQLPSLFERERGGIMRARVRKDYSRIFYYRSVRDGYLCVAYDGLDELMEQDGVTTQMARDLCCDLTTFLLDLIQSVAPGVSNDPGLINQCIPSPDHNDWSVKTGQIFC